MEIVKSKRHNGVKVFVSKNGNIIGQGRRAIKDGSKFDHLIRLDDAKHTSSLTYGNVDKTVQIMNEIIEKYHYQVADLAKTLEGNSELETCKNVWDFVFNHIQYKRDKVDKETLSVPARIWLNRSKESTPSDCDEHTVFCGALLYCLGIPFKIRIAGYDGNAFSHVYLVTQSDICVDTVLHAFNKEAYFTTKKDFKIMQIETLQGVEEPVELDGLGSLGTVDGLINSANEFDSQESEFLDEEEIENLDPTALNGVQDALMQEEVAARKFSKAQMKLALEMYQKEPQVYHAAGYTPEYWEHFKAAYNSLLNNDSLDGIVVNMGNGATWEKENLNPVNGIQNEHGETIGLLGGLQGLFKKIRRGFKKFSKWTRKTVKKGFKAVKQATKWAVKMVKKLAQFLMKLNPIMIVVRRIIAAKIKKNKKNMAIKMGYGLLTQQQANEIGLSKADYDKAKRAYAKFAKRWKWLGGSLSYLKKHVKKAWYDNGLKQGLKVVKLHGMDGLDGLGQLEGRRRRKRRRRKRWTKAYKKAINILEQKQMQLNVDGRITPSQKAAIKRRVDKYARKHKGQLQSNEYKAFYKTFKPVRKADVYGQDDYEADKRANDAAARKLKNQPRWKKEQITFLKQMFPSHARKAGLKGTSDLGAVAATSTAAATPIAMKIINWLFKILDKIGLGSFIKKAKEKHIANLKEKAAKATTPEAKKALEQRAAKAQKNLDILNKKKPEASPQVADRTLVERVQDKLSQKIDNKVANTAKKFIEKQASNLAIFNKTPEPTPEVQQVTKSAVKNSSVPSVSTTTGAPKKAGMNWVGIAVLGSVALGMVYKANQKPKNKKTSK